MIYKYLVRFALVLWVILISCGFIYGVASVTGFVTNTKIKFIDNRKEGLYLCYWEPEVSKMTCTRTDFQPGDKDNKATEHEL